MKHRKFTATFYAAHSTPPPGERVRQVSYQGRSPRHLRGRGNAPSLPSDNMTRADLRDAMRAHSNADSRRVALSGLSIHDLIRAAPWRSK